MSAAAARRGRRRALVTASLLQDCVTKFNKMRDDADNGWNTRITEAKQFAVKHDIEPYTFLLNATKNKANAGRSFSG